MLLVCDSGSTKADWLYSLQGKVSGSFETMGFNPFFHDSKIIHDELLKNREAARISKEVHSLYFFGAGCSSDARNKIILTGLQSVFQHASVTVDHDMLGAAIASCGDTAGLVCILGTGSNIAWYDGKQLSDTIHGIGYIMGDESSGSYYGKKLISRFLYRLMPDDLYRSFYEKYKMNKELMIEKVYQQPGANVYLASFARFLSDHKQHPWIKQLVNDGMMEFYNTNIRSYPQHKHAPVHFIGSIAHHFEDILRQIAGTCGFQIGKILVRPVDELMNYFLKKESTWS